jgi:O-succinylbenzoate synthase
MNDANGGGARKLVVWAVNEVPGEKARWRRIGIAFPNRDGSTNLLLDALPLGTNKLQVREEREEFPARSQHGHADLETVEVRP